MNDVSAIRHVNQTVRVSIALDAILLLHNCIGFHVENANARRAVDKNVLWEAFFVVGGQADVMERCVDEGEGREKHRHDNYHAGVHLKCKKKVEESIVAVVKSPQIILRFELRTFRNFRLAFSVVNYSNYTSLRNLAKKRLK